MPKRRRWRKVREEAVGYKRRCRELPEEVISCILSKLDNAKYIAVASTVCKSWKKGSLLVNTLKFSGLGQPADWFRMIRDRVDSLEDIHLMSEKQGPEVCLGIVGACHKLSSLSLQFGIGTLGLSFLEVFKILSTCKNLASLSFLTSFQGSAEVHVGEGWGLVRLWALKVLRIHGKIILDSCKEFCSAFPALEQLDYTSIRCRERAGAVFIESSTLRKLKIMCECTFLCVKAPKLTSLMVCHVERVHCECAVTVGCITVFQAEELICDASHVTSLVLGLGSLLRFRKLVKVQNLHYCGEVSMLNNLPAAALASVEKVGLRIFDPYFGSQVRSFFNNITQVKSLTLASDMAGGQVRPVCLPELKCVQYIVARSCSPCLLQFLVTSSPALASLDISMPSQSDVRRDEEVQMLSKLFELQRSKPELLINVASF